MIGKPPKPWSMPLKRWTAVPCADLQRIDIPSWENEPLLAKMKELRGDWDRKLAEQMDEIMKRGR